MQEVKFVTDDVRIDFDSVKIQRFNPKASKSSGFKMQGSNLSDCSNSVLDAALLQCLVLKKLELHDIFQISFSQSLLQSAAH